MRAENSKVTAKHDKSSDIKIKVPDSASLKHVPPSQLKPCARNARTHSKKQIGQIAKSIDEFGFNNPILVDANYEVIAGHGRLAAANQLGLNEVPVVCLSHLNAAEKRAYILADNKIALNAGWDSELLASELEELAELLPELDLDLDITGFETGEIDALLTDHETSEPRQRLEDEVPDLRDQHVAKSGDTWQLGPHRLLCGDARDASSIAALMGEEQARMVLSDPPYNVKIAGHVGGRGNTKHQEFAFASGEMTDEEFGDFLSRALVTMRDQSHIGAVLYIFMDWRHIELLLSVGRKLDLDLRNICVWSKTTPGQGSFYRSAHELCAVFAKPGESPVNNVQLGRFGRNRSNVWSYPGVNTFQARKGGDLSLHPTVKPVGMIADAIKDASKRGDVVLDPFLGSGSTLIAAEKVGRRCFGVEYEPGYIDVAIRRWQQFTGKDAVLLHRDVIDDVGDAEGKTFDELAPETKDSSEKAS